MWLPVYDANFLTERCRVLDFFFRVSTMVKVKSREVGRKCPLLFLKLIFDGVPAPLKLHAVKAL